MEVISRPIGWVLAQPLRLLLLLELQLLLRDCHRAEYLADRLAAEVAGTSAVIRVHEKLLLEGTAEIAVQRAALARTGPAEDVFESMRTAFEDVPERELERRRRVARLESARLGSSHPPTGRRIELLERTPARTAAVTLDPPRHEAIEGELAALRPRLSRRLVDEYRLSVEA